jgi:hypothetical protein
MSEIGFIGSYAIMTIRLCDFGDEEEEDGNGGELEYGEDSSLVL